MRTNQISIHLDRFADQEQLGVSELHLNIYADANNVYEALTAAYFEVLQQLQVEGAIDLPTFGRREHYTTNNFAYRSQFQTFLKEQGYEEQWHDFQQALPTPEDQFLQAQNLTAKFKSQWLNKLTEKNNDSEA